MRKLIQMRDIRKSFFNVEVLHGVSLELYEGEVLALVGENGAGKSTLMKILMGIHQADSGDILFNGKSVEIQNPSRALHLGISMIHQELNPVLDMTVAENMFLGREISRHGFVNNAEQRARTQEWLNRLNIDLDPDVKLRRLTTSQLQIVEIVKAISYNARVIIMDEPTSAITNEDAENLFRIIKLLKKDGIGIIYISHRLDELPQVADRVEILRDGNLINVSAMADLSRNDMIRDMVGREITNIYPACDQQIGDTKMEVKNFSSPGKFKDISFSLYQGEKLGIAGLMGAGRTELLNAIFGADANAKGMLLIDGEEVHIRSPRDAIRHKIALVPEDRKQLGLNLIGSVQDNVTMCIDRLLAKAGFLQNKAAKEKTDKMINSLSIKVNDVSSSVMNLSGGNQQKVVLAKWLLTEPDVLLFDEPTRGIDVGAKSEIFNLINQLVLNGKSVIVVSSEMQEIIGVTDRVLVMCEGRLTGELRGDDITQENIMSLAAPVKE